MEELVEKRNKLKALQDAMAAVNKLAGNDLDFLKVDKINGEDVKKITTMAKVEKVRKMNDEMGELGADVDKLVEAEKALKASRIGEGKPAVVHPANGNQGAKSLGEQIIQSDWYKSVKARGGAKPTDPESQLSYGVAQMKLAYKSAELKTLFQTSAGLSPESTRTGLIVDAVTRPIQILDIIPTTPTGQAAFVYLEETTRTHAAAEKDEAAAFAESTFVLTERSSTVRKVTDSIPTTDEQLADEPVVQGYLSGRLEFGLRQRLDLQIVVGDGVAPNLEGILNVTGIQTQALGGDPVFDAAMKALTKVRVTGRATPNAFIFHPNDWEVLVLTRTADGLYILGNPANGTPQRLWGLQVVVSDAITENTGLTGDFANFCLLAERQGVEIATGFVNDDFTKGRVTMRGTLRVAFPTLRPAAFCTITGI